MLLVQFIRGGNKYFQRCVICVRVYFREVGVDSVVVFFYRRDRVRYVKIQVMVSVYVSLRFWFQFCFQGAETVTDIVYVYRIVRIYYINIGRIVVFYQFCLFGEIFRRGYMVYYQKINGVYFEFAGILNMLGGNISFGIVRCYTNYSRVSLLGIFQIVNSVDFWQ